MTRTSRLTASFAAAALMLTPFVGVPGAAQAAPSKPTRDSIVRMDTGTAYSKALGNHRYQISLPGAPNIEWLGMPPEPGGRPPMGMLKPQDVAKVWAALGHRANVGVPTRVTWNAPGEDFTDWRSGYLTSPRIGKDGRLTVTMSGVRGGLPKVLPDFSLNVSPSSEKPRSSFGVTISPIHGTSDKALAITVNNLTSGSLTIDAKDDSGTWTTCTGVADPLIVMGGEARKNFSYGSVSCGNVKIQAGDPTYIGWYPQKSSGTLKVLPCYRVEVPTGNQAISYCNAELTFQ